jgi:hypothetical protein
MEKRTLTESNTFIMDYERMIQGTLGLLKIEARLLVTGYVTFFNEQTDQSSYVSFSKTDRAIS